MRNILVLKTQFKLSVIYTVIFSVLLLQMNCKAREIKGIVHPKMKMWCLSTYPQGIQDVGDFVSSVEHKQRFLTQTVAVCQSYNSVPVAQW